MEVLCVCVCVCVSDFTATVDFTVERDRLEAKVSLF